MEGKEARGDKAGKEELTLSIKDYRGIVHAIEGAKQEQDKKKR